METKEKNTEFSGKAIYRPKGKAGEYARWAANLYVGCSNGCTYCYCRKGVLKHAMGGERPELKKCFKDEMHAVWTFNHELLRNKQEIIRDGGIFLSFTTDPCHLTTWKTHFSCVLFALASGVPVTILTKCVGWLEEPYTRYLWDNPQFKDRLCVGFTLTGMDDMEPDAASNDERIEAMEMLHSKGIRTFASIEPVIDINKSMDMITRTRSFCDLYKIGLLTGVKRNYGRAEVVDMIADVLYMSQWILPLKKVYFKDTVLQAAWLTREDLNQFAIEKGYEKTLAGPDYNIFDDFKK